MTNTFFKGQASLTYAIMISDDTHFNYLKENTLLTPCKCFVFSAFYIRCKNHAIIN